MPTSLGCYLRHVEGYQVVLFGFIVIFVGVLYWLW